MNMEAPREEGRLAIRATVPEALWEQNDRFAQSLRSNLLRHPISAHPVREFFESGVMSRPKQLNLHLEFGYGFAQIFTDAVLNAMATATQLENRLGPRAKVTARFLWALNLSDELGYVPSGNTASYAGHPNSAHYFQYVEMFPKLGAKENAILHHDATPMARAARKTFEENYQDYALLTTVLALSESVFDKYAGSWADNVARSENIDTKTGYHSIHVQHDDGHSVDDDHSEDSWTLVKQALTPERYEEIEAKCEAWLDIWAQFADHVMSSSTD